MNRQAGARVFGLAGVLLALVYLPGCGNSGKQLHSGGSTFLYPMMSKWAREYKAATGIELTYESVGSGSGIQRMTAGTYDFGCTDVPMNEEQIRQCRETGSEPLHIPLVLGAVVPLYNLEDVREPLKFTGPLLADIFLGRIKKWNDPALRELNPGTALPEQDIVVVHRSDASGTTYIWTDYLAKVSEQWKQKVGVGTRIKWPVGLGVKGCEGVAGTVRRSPGTIGYGELAYALQNELRFGLVGNRNSRFVKASMKSVMAAAEGAIVEASDDLRLSVTDAPGTDSYPICGVIWAVLYLDQTTEKGKHIVDFLHWAIHEGQEHCDGLNYSRLPTNLIQRVEKKCDQIKVAK